MELNKFDTVEIISYKHSHYVGKKAFIMDSKQRQLEQQIMPRQMASYRQELFLICLMESPYQILEVNKRNIKLVTSVEEDRYNYAILLRDTKELLEKNIDEKDFVAAKVTGKKYNRLKDEADKETLAIYERMIVCLD